VSWEMLYVVWVFSLVLWHCSFPVSKGVEAYPKQTMVLQSFGESFAGVEEGSFHGF